jgi:hypothetical protein
LVGRLTGQADEPGLSRAATGNERPHVGAG